jgi:ABC-type lipoprotein release transport system permease subunit
VSSLARLGLPPTIVAGARMALEPGRGRTAVPVRTTLAGVTLGLAALAGALTFGASLTHLLDTPRLYGWNWDEVVTTYGADPNPDLDPHREAIAAVRGIESASIGSSGVPIVVGDTNSIEGSALALDPVKGSVLPPLLAGRPPAAADEIALAAVTMRRAGIAVGDTVDVRIPGFRRKRVAVVGRVVIPPLVGGDARLGQGGLLTLEGLNRLAPPDDGDALATDLLLRLSPGADRRRVLADLHRDAWPRSPPNAELQVPFEVVRREEPSDLVNFGRVDNLPVLLAGVLALLAGATLAHLLLSAIRRRRRDLAVLKTIGFVRRQVLATVAWQATTLATVALLIGVPLGIAAGRWSWAVLADRLGVVREPVIPLASVLILVPATILVANLIAVLPARMAARTRPAAVLRAE